MGGSDVSVLGECGAEKALNADWTLVVVVLVRDDAESVGEDIGLEVGAPSAENGDDRSSNGNGKVAGDASQADPSPSVTAAVPMVALERERAEAGVASP